ncbi:protein kinase [Streptomyces sp. NBC_00454]|uniref:serine/threonine-protein kinase n=1 Tax=Streptomyces sp. NBC_00454 TaxID=2975747 RepID=UPI0030E4679A
MAAGNDVFPAKLAQRYQPLRVLGRGGMGVVFEAEDTTLRRRVAVKVLSASAKNLSREMQRRFVSEAIALARISHPGVVGIYDSGVDSGSGTPYLVMEMLDGADLFVLGAGVPFAVPAACWIAVEMLGALEAAHTSGVLHRDVKPGNVRVTPDGKVVLYDFGLALVAEERRITATGSDIIGTAQYMAPERVRRLPSSGATDLYGVGVCLHFMLTGRPPFGEETVDVGALVLKAAEGVSRIREKGLGLPDELAAAVDALCAPDYRERPDSAASAAALLRPWAGGGGSQVLQRVTGYLARPVPRAQRRRIPPTHTAAEAERTSFRGALADMSRAAAPGPSPVPRGDEHRVEPEYEWWQGDEGRRHSDEGGGHDDGRGAERGAAPAPFPYPQSPAPFPCPQSPGTPPGAPTVASTMASTVVPAPASSVAPTVEAVVAVVPEAPNPLALSEITRRLVHGRMTEHAAVQRQREAVGLVMRGKPQEASQLLAGVLQFCQETLGPGHPTILACQFWQAVCLARTGQSARALQLFARVREHQGQGRAGAG